MVQAELCNQDFSSSLKTDRLKMSNLRTYSYFLNYMETKHVFFLNQNILTPAHLIALF